MKNPILGSAFWPDTGSQPRVQNMIAAEKRNCILLMLILLQPDLSTKVARCGAQDLPVVRLPYTHSH